MTRRRITRHHSWGDEHTLPLPYLKAWRQRACWSQFDLAAHSNVSVNTIGRLERGTTTVRLAVVHRLAAALGVSNATLAGRPSADEERIVPPVRVQAVIDEDGELAFYIAPRWRWLETWCFSRSPRALLAARTGIDEATLARIERQQPAPLAQVRALARACHRSVLEAVEYV